MLREFVTTNCFHLQLPSNRIKSCRWNKNIRLQQQAWAQQLKSPSFHTGEHGFDLHLFILASCQCRSWEATGDGSGSWLPANHMGDLDFEFQATGPGIWGSASADVNSHYNSATQIKKKIIITLNESLCCNEFNQNHIFRST